MKLTHSVLVFAFCVGLVRAQNSRPAETPQSQPTVQRFHPDVAGTVIFLDLVSVYGDHRTRLKSEVERLYFEGAFKQGKTRGNLWWRIRTQRRKPGMAAMHRCASGTFWGIRVRNGNLHFFSKSGSDSWEFGREFARIKNTDVASDVVPFQWDHAKDFVPTGSSSPESFTFYVEDGSPAAVSLAPDMDENGLLKLLVEDMHRQRGTENSLVFFLLASYFSLSDIMGSKEVEETYGAMVNMMRERFRKSGNNEPPLFPSVEQAALRSGLSEFSVAGFKERVESLEDGLPIYRWLAEDTTLPKEARRKALERCLQLDESIEFHREWIEMLEAGEFGYGESEVEALLTRLDEEASAWSLGELWASIIIGTAALAAAVALFRKSKAAA